MTTTTTILDGTIDLADLHGTTLDRARRYDVDQLDFRGFRRGDGSRVDHIQGMHYADWFRDGEYLGPDDDGVEPVFAADSVRRSMRTIKLFSADGTYQGEFAVYGPSEGAVDAIREELERGGHAEVWADGQRAIDTPATTPQELAEQITMGM